ncbi:hypothetical protein VX159_00725 [Dechloromonas sp. ZY10]|uniref:hypothetical protein n=1 Tax=Dechloromonas aquae TaxID=2664436 RepID=UPI003528DAC7
MGRFLGQPWQICAHAKEHLPWTSITAACMLNGIFKATVKIMVRPPFSFGTLSMNISALESAYQTNQVAQAICDHMANRDKNQTETKLHRMLTHLQNDGFDFKRGDVIGAFRLLENVGCGKYVEGRHGWPSRFVWMTKSLLVSSAAKGQEPPIHEATPDCDNDSAEDIEFIEHSFVLRPDIPISFELPADLTEYEASRIAAFIKTLPFGEH